MSIKTLLERYKTLPDKGPYQAEIERAVKSFDSRLAVSEKQPLSFQPGSLYPLIKLFTNNHSHAHPHWKRQNFSFEQTACMRWLIDVYREVVLQSPRHQLRARHRFFEHIIQENEQYLTNLGFNISCFKRVINEINQEAQQAYHRRFLHRGQRFDQLAENKYLLYDAITHDLPDVEQIEKILSRYAFDAYHLDLETRRTTALFEEILKDKDLKEKQFYLFQGFYRACRELDKRKKLPENYTIHQYAMSLNPHGKLKKKIDAITKANKKAQERAKTTKRFTQFFLSFTVIEPTTMLSEAVSGIFFPNSLTVAYTMFFVTVGLGIIFACTLIYATFSLCEEALKDVYLENEAKKHFKLKTQKIQQKDYYASKTIYAILGVIEATALLLFTNNTLTTFVGSGLLALGPAVWGPVLAVTLIQAIGLVVTMMVTDMYPIVNYFKRKDYEEKLNSQLLTPYYFGKGKELVVQDGMDVQPSLDDDLSGQLRAAPV